MATFAERMIELRKERNLKKAKAAREMGLSRSTITLYENGERTNPTSDILQKIADYYNVSIDYLTGKSNIRERLTANELVEIFRQLKDENKLQLLKYARYILKEQEENGERISN